MKRPPTPIFLLLVFASLGILFLNVGCGTASGSGSLGSNSARKVLAKSLLQDPKVSLANFHVSGRRDSATALDNMRQASAGKRSQRSSYQRAPGGATYLSTRMMRAMKILSREGYSYRVTELAGGSHSRNSSHYRGVSFDVDYINKVKVGYGNPYYRRFMKRCRQLGAKDVGGPGDGGHRTHVHAEW